MIHTMAEGIDTIDFSALSGAVNVTLNGSSNGTATEAGIGTDTLINIENVKGGTGDDTIIGDA